MNNKIVYTPEEFALAVIAAISRGQYGVKVKKDGSILLDVGGYMQEDGSIGKHSDEKFSPENFQEYMVDQ